MPSDWPWVPRKVRAAILGVGPRSSQPAADQGGPGVNVRCQKRLGSLLREDISPDAAVVKRSRMSPSGGHAGPALLMGTHTPYPPGVGQLAVRGQGRSVGGQINIQPLGLIRLWNFAPEREAGGEQVWTSGRGFWQVQNAGHLCGCLRLDIRRSGFQGLPHPGSSLLPGWRGGPCSVISVGTVEAKPRLQRAALRQS